MERRGYLLSLANRRRTCCLSINNMCKQLPDTPRAPSNAARRRATTRTRATPCSEARTPAHNPSRC
eukprot:6236618-Pyramimonas_sp.AAC.2